MWREEMRKLKEVVAVFTWAGPCSVSYESVHDTHSNKWHAKRMPAKTNNTIRGNFACAKKKAWTLPLHGFSSIRQVHFNTVLPLICLHANPIEQPSFPEFRVHCKTQASITVSFTRYNVRSMSICFFRYYGLRAIQTVMMLLCLSIQYNQTM